MDNKKFTDFYFSEEILKGVERMGFSDLTPVQAETFTPFLKGKDVIVQAPTGTGKTCAFGIPMIEKINSDSKTVDAIVLCPTRELVIQTCEELTKVSKFKKGINIVAIYGGQPIDKQIFALKKKPQIIVATPGRLIDHLKRKTVKIKDLKILVLDEADEMLNMGFKEDLDVILETVPTDRQTVLFSATMPEEIINIANKYQKENPCHIKVTKDELTVNTVKQYYLEVKLPNRIETIERLIDANKYKLCMIFCNTKKKVDEISAELRQHKYPADALHGDMKQMQRDRVMSRFKKGITGILVATDVAARGIDVDDVDAVFNYEIPEDFEYYVHRIGRTGRANKEGISYTFVSGREVKKLKELMKYTKGTISLITPPSLKEVKAVNLECIMEDAKCILEDNNFKDYREYLEKYTLANNVDIFDLSATLLKMLNEGKKSDISHEKKEKNHNDENKVRLFVNLGKMDKMGTNNMIDLLKNGGVLFEQIGKIEIMPKFSFVDVEEEAVNIIMETLNGSFYKKRKIMFEVSNKKDKKKEQKTKTRKKGSY
ncbi:MAG: DEAD/DEAH box helicase [Ruminococcaceae bacterium]|nr:DEAD/DEAH box helicase [Oscillospiraceae bacterium]